MLTTQHRKLFEESLNTDQPTARLREAIHLLLKEPKRTRDALLAELEEFRTILRAHHRESDEDVVLEVMDFLVGWASPQATLVPAKHGRNKRSGNP